MMTAAPAGRTVRHRNVDNGSNGVTTMPVRGTRARLSTVEVTEGYVPGSRWSDVPVPRAFALVGQSVRDPGSRELCVDAYAMELPDGRVVSFCTCGHCTPRMQMWPSWRDAASWHGSSAVWATGDVTEPDGS